jgi:hypothetical protein
MTEPPYSAPREEPPQEALRKASRKRILLMLCVGGFVLAIGGCGLFLFNLDIGGASTSQRETLAAIGAIVFFAGVLAFVVGCIWAFSRWVARRFDKAED